MMSDDLLPSPLSARAVRSYINFDGGDTIALDGSLQAELQSKGVAAIWQLLRTKGYAYLADEVGMGKTRQAMGVIATQFLSNPRSHVVIVCPGKTLQMQWAREWDTFIRTCYKALDDRLVSAVDGRPLQSLHLHERLSDFAKALLLNESRIHLLRYSSFSRPIWFSPKSADTPDGVLAQYVASLNEIGISQANQSEVKLVWQAAADKEGWRELLTAQLNEAFSGHVGTLLKSRCIDLVTLDEAQYLRHVENRQNTNLVHVFRGNVPKWQFLSATPLHSGEDDIKSLDSYLCRRPEGYDNSKACGNCTVRDSCTQAAYRMRRNSPDRVSAVTVLADFMVRRPRSFNDGNSPPRSHDKVGYRRYVRVASAASADPFLALTMAVVQKQLVGALNGQSNRFRQGECSSFESLAASVNRIQNDRDGNPSAVPEIDKQEYVGDRPPEKTPDRDIINRLNASFFSAMLPSLVRGNTPDPKYNLPHAKLTQVCDALTANNFLDGSLRKTVVFARRLDTVNELVLLLMSRFQGVIDSRINVWRDFLNQAASGITLREPVWLKEGFWVSRASDDNDPPEDTSKQEDDDAAGDGDQQLSNRAAGLAYFEAVKRASGTHTEHGKLKSFQSRLLTAPPKSGPFAGFLLPRPATINGLEEASVWDAAQLHWEQLLYTLLGADSSKPGYAWLFERAPMGESTWRLATLKRCLLQSMRQSDFLVDLYILNRFILTTPGSGGDVTLAPKLNWLLSVVESDLLPDALQRYLRNWKARFRLWLDHFDLIVDKCLPTGGDAKWERIYTNVDAAFSRMAPVAGRSGILSNKNAVTQFNFPTHPNILVCTDVLKEGVDMHLFCDDIVHYGVAWTSGDLEQRIGRIDRFGSKISRRIEAYTRPELAGMPRLNVEFPYLEGTLDRYQVERVMLAKVQSDMRLDLGKSAVEIGQITIGRLENPDEAGGVPQLAKAQYPACTLAVVDGAIESKGTFATVRQLGVRDPERTHAPEVGAMIVRKPWSGEFHPLLLQFLTSAIRGKKAARLVQQEYLAPLSQASTAPTLGVGDALQRSAPIAVSLLPYARDFQFEPECNTLTRQIRISDPFRSGVHRIQNVLLERMQDYLLLRTPVAGLSPESELPYWTSIINKENQCRSWGYLIYEKPVVWFVCFVLMPVGSLNGDMLETLSERVAKIGDHLQHLYCKGGDNQEWSYRARTSITDIAARHRAYFSERNHGFMTTVIDDLRAHGQLLAASEQWLSDGFATVLNTLYDKNLDERGLETLPISMLNNGVLQIRTKGPERFKIAAYLQLTPSRDEEDTLPPRLIWQVTTSTASRGPKPDLALNDWEQLRDSIPKEHQGDGVAFCNEDSDGNRRHFVFCHAPAKWDTARTQMISAWAQLLGYMNTSNFQRKRACSSFMDALK